ncbi:MAG: CHC2 zinc finger domain-containing protein [Ferrovibrionaceae bacterium]
MAGIGALDEIIRRSDIVEVARTLGVRLGPRQTDHTLAICPFHTDTKPSLALYRDANNPHYHCFACGAHGGVIDFVERKRQSSREDAVRWLAREVGVELPRHRAGARGRDAGAGPQAFEAWLEANNSSELLRRFAEQRRIDPGSLRLGGGYAVDMDRLVLSQLSPGQSEAWEQAGVLVRRKGELVAIARGDQIVFQIEGGFVFRKIEGDTGGDKGRRYRFSKGLRKSDVLFGASRTAERVAAGNTNYGLFVVEGLMDALRLHSLGLAAVAILGTSLSSRQADQIGRLCAAEDSSVVPVHLFLDADDAGRRATPSALRSLLNVKAPVPVDVVWPDRRGDPDELLRGSAPDDAVDQLAGWTHSALAVLVAGYTGFPVSSAFDELLTARPLRRVETLRYVLSQLGARWSEVRDLADPAAVYLPGADDQEGTWLRDSIDRAAGFRPKAATQQPEAYKAPAALSEEPDIQLRRALRIAQSSNFRREYPFDWGGMTRLALAAKASTMSARELLRDPRRRPLPYAARFVPKDDGRTRLKAGPWPEDSLLQQYVLSELLRARPDVPGWYTGFPAVRRIRTTSAIPVMTGPDKLRPVGPPDETAPVVAFAYQIDQEILEGEAPPAREGMFVPYRECWQQFIDHFDNFVARQPLDAGIFYAVRLDISGFFDNLPRYAVDNVLREAVADAAERCFAGRAFSDEVAALLAPESEVGAENNRARAEFVVDWLADQSFGFRYFDPGDGQIVNAPNATVGVPQGPDLSAFLANMALFPLDHAATALIEEERSRRANELDSKPRSAAAYGRYVDDMVIVSTSEALLSDIETLIGEHLRRLGLAMNAKHERTKALSRRRIREWLLGEKGAAVLVSAGGEETPSTDRTRVEDLLTVTAETPRSRVLQLLYHPDLFAERWASDAAGRKQVEGTLQRMRGLPSIKLRYNDWVSAARWALHSFIIREPDASVQQAAEGFWEEWSELYGRDTAEESFGESERDYATRQAQLTLAPLNLVLEGLERSIDSRHDRRTGLDADLRRALGRSREQLARLVYEHDFCDVLINTAARDPALHAVTPRVATMLRIQSLAIRGLAATVCAAVGLPRHSLSLEATAHYAVRRFALNGLDRDISAHAAPIVGEVPGASEIAGSPEAEPLLGLHEAIARLLADGSSGKDPLDPLSTVIHRSIANLSALVGEGRRGLGPALYLTALTNQFLSAPAAATGGPDAGEALRAFVEIVAGAPDSNQRLQERQHLLSMVAGANSAPIAVSPGVDVRAFFATQASELKAFSVVNGQSVPSPQDVLFGVEATAIDGEAQLAAFACEIPSTHNLLDPRDRKVKPEDVSADDVLIFARAYRDLATVRAAAMDDDACEAEKDAAKAAYWPVTPFHLFQPKAAQHRWLSFGAVAGLPVESQAFVRLTKERLHSVAVHANGSHLWQVGFALADALGYRGFVRSSELDRLSVAALEPDDSLESIPFYMMQLTVPRLCGAFMGRSRIPVRPSQGLPAAIEHQLERLEALSAIRDNALHLTRLLELGAETKAAELLRETPAPLQVAGALSAVFGAVGRAASRAEPIFAEHLPKPKPQVPTNRRIVDLWLAGASRIEGLGPDRTTIGLETAAAAMRVLAIARLLEALTLEVWSLLSDDDRRRIEDFSPDPADLDLPQEILLVSRAQSQRSPTAGDQVVRLLSVLAQHAAPGATARSTLEQITPLGWLVALATVTGLIDIEPLPHRTHEPRLRPELFAARKEVTKSGRTSDSEQKLWTSLSDLSQYLARGAEDETIYAVQDASWPWRGFAPLVSDAARMADVACEAARMIDRLYGLVAETRSSRLFQVSEADDKGYCLVVREAQGRQNLAGWQIDRDSLGVTRPGDLECRNDQDGTLAFVWSETRLGERLVGMSLGYRSLAAFAGLNKDSTSEVPGWIAPDEPKSGDLHLLGRAPSDTAAAQAESLFKPVEATQDSRASGGKAGDEASASGQPPIGGRRHGDDALERLKQLWHGARRPRPSAEARSTLRIALLQMSVHDIGHSFYHPVCEMTERSYRKWEECLKKLRNDGAPSKTSPSWFEARRRAILREALERCATLDVELLILPEYAMRADTVAWLSAELESLGASTSILAGTFRHPARAAPLPYHTGVGGREIGLGAIVPLIVPGRALGGGDGRSRGAKIYSRLKKYPSTGLSEFIRPEDKRLKAVYDMFVTDPELPERLRYIRDLICSEVFVAMAPANIYSTVPHLLELHERFGTSGSVNADYLQNEILADLVQIAKDTSPAIGRPLAKPRQTIMAVPAATTRPFDHHIFGEAGAKAAGLTTVFANMAGEGGGESCFIGCYRSSGIEGSSVSSLQSPYHGRAPGIWTYRFSGGAPLGKDETALVVADVNPIDTVTSKPARQVEAQPITLVAHIPFFLGTAENDSLTDKARALARRILNLDAAIPVALSSCNLTIGQVDELRAIANDLVELDSRAADSLRLRAQGLQVASMQPHAHPRMPVLIDWAYVPAPAAAVEIEFPLLDAVALTGLETV